MVFADLVSPPRLPHRADPMIATNDATTARAALGSSMRCGRIEPQYDQLDYAWINELGGFVVAGPCSVDEITRRYGRGSYRVSAYGFEPAGLRWEVLVEDLA